MLKNCRYQNWHLQKNNYLLYLGRIVPEKGLEYLIKAFKNLDTEKKLVIAGGASDTNDFYDKMVQLAKDDKRIMFIGFVQGSILEELYSNAYIYVLPSDLEGMPLTLLEAMSYGNCCVVSNIPECTEVIQDKGLIFKKGDIKNLYNILEKCCNDVNLVQSYKNSSENYILTKYNWDDIAKLTLQIYKNTNS